MKLDGPRWLIGGEMELDRVTLGPLNQLAGLTRGMRGTWTSSGRSALGLVLRGLKSRGVTHVHLPAYVCRSVLLPVRALGLDFSFYPVARDLAAQPEPPAGAAVLLIHYFGWLNPSTARLRAQAGGDFELIEDASHAMLSAWGGPAEKMAHTFFSARKFGALPWGGWCNEEARLEPPRAKVESLVWRVLAACLAKGAYLSHPEEPVEPEVERMYLEAFRAVEDFLEANPMEGAVPELALEVQAGRHWEGIGRQRRSNWACLNAALGGEIERIFPVMPEGVVPLGYPIRIRNRDKTRGVLRERRVFCAVHWLLPEEVDAARFPEAAALAEECLTLPLDERYGPLDMERLGTIWKDVL